jgi:hypothetical protein
MKTSQYVALATVILAVGTVMPSRTDAQTTPTIPVGDLSAFPTVVQTGTKPTLTWNISYPSVVENFVTITPPGTVTPKENLVCDVRILGLGVTSQGSNNAINYFRTRGQWRFNGASSWSTIYDGMQTDTIVQQQGLVRTNVAVNRNSPMNFAGQFFHNSTWQTLFTSLNGQNVRALVSGQLCPGNVPDYNAPSLESFLKPYLDASKRVRIGPMDVIIIMELTHTDQSNIGYDLPDLVMLVTFRRP